MKNKSILIRGLIGGVIGLIFFLPGLIKRLEIQGISWALNFVILVGVFTLLGIPLGIFVGFIISKIKKKGVWVGALIGICIFLIGLLGAKITGGQFQPVPWTETSLLGQFLVYTRIILLFPTFIVGFLFWGCEYTPRSFPFCRIIAETINIVIYAIIGALIGFIITKIRGRNNE